MEGDWTIRLLILLTAGINTCLVIILLMQKWTLDRMRALAKRLQEIGISGDLSQRVTVTGSDELAELESAANDMLTRQEQAQSHIRRLHRLQAVGTLATGIAHEINNPLNVMQLNASALEMFLTESGTLDREMVLKKLKIMSREIEKVRDIVKHMRMLVRNDAKREFVPVDLSACLDELKSSIGSQLEARKIVFKTTGSSKPVRADRLEMGQVLLNLVGNARDALDEFTTPDGLPKEISLTIRQLQDVAEIMIEDNGPGLGEHSDNIFDPFFTTKEAGRGMGMGLAIVHTLVSGWGGSITAEDIHNRGARFTFTVPLVSDEVAASKSQPVLHE